MLKEEPQREVEIENDRLELKVRAEEYMMRKEEEECRLKRRVIGVRISTRD